jgi:hypothetical protein
VERLATLVGGELRLTLGTITHFRHTYGYGIVKDQVHIRTVQTLSQRQKTPVG